MVLEPGEATSGLLHPSQQSWGLSPLPFPSSSCWSLQTIIEVLKLLSCKTKHLQPIQSFLRQKILGVLKNAVKGTVLNSLYGTKSRGGLRGEDLKNGQDITITVFYRND